MAARATIYDIADATGVSPSTVSRVLSGSSLIGNEVAQRVEDAADRLGYQKRKIRRQADRAILTIPVVFPRYERAYLHQFFDVVTLVEGIRASVAPTRVHLVVETMGVGGRTEAAVDLFAHKKAGDIDAAIFAFTKPPQEVYDSCRQRGVPCCTLNRIIPDGDYITADNFNGAGELFHRAHAARSDIRPMFVRPSGRSEVATERRRGLASACKAAGVDFGREHELVVSDGQAVDSLVIERLLAMNCNAVFAFNDLMAISLVQAARECGVQVPEQLMVIGYDDAPVRRLVRPIITSMTMPIDEIARSTGDWIVEAVLNRSTERFQRHLPGDFCLGETIPDGVGVQNV